MNPTGSKDLSCDLYPFQSGCSAVWQGKYGWFYSIHGTEIFVILLSTVSSIIVILSIFLKHKQETSLGFSERFPLYIALNDLIWGICHSASHILILINQIYPGEWEVLLVATLNCSAWAYQQLMYAAISIHTYMKVVHRSRISLGKWEWKLHIGCWLIVGITTLFWHYTGTMGISRYCIGIIEAGNISYGYICLSIFSSIQAFSVVACYYGIRRTVISQRKDITKKMEAGHRQYDFHDVASKCLTGFVAMGIFLYTPIALTLWLAIILPLLGVAMLDLLWPLPFALVLINCGGFVNALVFFRNRRIKNQKKSCRSNASRSTGNTNDAV